MAWFGEQALVTAVLLKWILNGILKSQTVINFFSSFEE